MHDIITTETIKPDRSCLERLAYSQDGFFTSRDGRDCGFSPQLLHHYFRSGRVERVRRGLYRLTNYPTSAQADVRAKWLACGPDAVVSHESALELLGLSDVIPNEVHITVPRWRRGLRVPQGVILHTTNEPDSNLVWREGIAVTPPAQSIADATQWGTAPEQIEMAVSQALSRGLATIPQLRSAARDSRVARAIERALARAPALS
jgi:predicted transcriptional regulator of viral defense system